MVSQFAVGDPDACRQALTVHCADPVHALLLEKTGIDDARTGMIAGYPELTGRPRSDGRLRTQRNCFEVRRGAR